MNYLPRRRLKPILAPTAHAIFHVVSRVVDRRHIFGPDEKEKFLSYLRRYERFCRVRIIGYCLMDNHFHLLVKVPGRPQNRPTQAVLMEHLRETLGETIAGQYQERIDFWEQQIGIGQQRRKEKSTSAEWATASVQGLESPMDALLGEGDDLLEFAEAQLEKVSQDIWQRMYDVSQLVFSLKQQFSQWYNKKNDRVGTLWEDRFRSTVVQDGPAVAEVAAYIDLNPVRAGLVKDAKDFAWSQYGSAVSGDAMALQAVEYVMRSAGWLAASKLESFERIQAPSRGLHLGFAIMEYLLRRRGMESADLNRDSGLDGHDPLPSARYTQGPLRSFTRGVAIGDTAFLNKIFGEHRALFGPKRMTAARAIRFYESALAEGESRDVSPLERKNDTPRQRSLIQALRDIRIIKKGQS